MGRGDGRFRRLNRGPSGPVSHGRLIASAVGFPAVLMIVLGGLSYLFNHGHPAALDRGLFAGLLIGGVTGLFFSWQSDRRFAGAQLVIAVLVLWGYIAWNPVYRIYVAHDPLDVRLKLIDRKDD